jgi:dienelactone hydrolase
MSQITPGELVAAGFATLAYDHIGIGGRQRERRDFYVQYPRWSLMGKMVHDARHAIDAAVASPEVDPSCIFLYGYAMGGLIATLVAALDERVTGVASVAGFTPWRTDPDSKGTGGVRRYSHLYGWIPRLGSFVGREKDIPVDLDEILALVAPRPALVVAPELDRHATLSDIKEAIRQVGNAYSVLGARGALRLETPYDENRLSDAIQRNVISWLKQQSGA